MVEIDEMRKQIDALESQIKAEKQFIESQMIEREQEQEEYERRLAELTEALNKRENFSGDVEQTSVDKVKIKIHIFYYL